MKNPRSIRSSDMKKAREEAERKRDEMVQKEKDESKRANAARYKEGVRKYSKEAVNTPPSSMLGKASKFVRTKIGDPFERTFGPDKYAEGPDAGQLRARREYLGYKKGGTVKMSGGSASKRADGIASKGKTKGKMVKMAYGGRC